MYLVMFQFKKLCIKRYSFFTRKNNLKHSKSILNISEPYNVRLPDYFPDFRKDKVLFRNESKDTLKSCPSLVLTRTNTNISLPSYLDPCENPYSDDAIINVIREYTSSHYSDSDLYSTYSTQSMDNIYSNRYSSMYSEWYFNPHYHFDQLEAQINFELDKLK